VEALGDSVGHAPALSAWPHLSDRIAARVARAVMLNLDIGIPDRQIHLSFPRLKPPESFLLKRYFGR
jgi:hypothetical protein